MKRKEIRTWWAGSWHYMCCRMEWIYFKNRKF